ncbi:RNA polymerase sigma-70 factor (ECF subfamily) [Catenulispora sp. EB89]|uniref:RNA polymerase sigma factor n=1 Tax=Catenulispora sp. EB89 TaxID=3156257 RepID=UPI0035149D05
MSLLTSRAAPPATTSRGKEEGRLAELLQKVAAGDTKAFATVYGVLAPRIWAMAAAVTCDRDRAEAAAVQAFEAVWRAAPRCPSDPEAATAWAMRIAVDRTIRAATDPRPPTLKPPPLKPPVASERQSERLHPTLLALPERQRDAILLSCYGRLPLRTLACALEVPKQDAAALLCDALIGVREGLRSGRLPSCAKTL